MRGLGYSIGVFAIAAFTANGVHADQSGVSINSGACLSAEKLALETAAAEKNDLSAIRDLEVYYTSCVGNRDKVLAYSKDAADVGTADDVESYAVVVESYDSKKTAFQWHLKAAQMGNSRAKLNVAEAYWDGDVVPKDFKQAYMWLQLGATCQELGVVDMGKLAEFLWTEKPVPLSGPKALAWFTIVDEKTGLIPYYKTMRDEIKKSLSTEELSMATNFASEFAQDAGCVDLTNANTKK